MAAQQHAAKAGKGPNKGGKAKKGGNKKTKQLIDEIERLEAAIAAGAPAPGSAAASAAQLPTAPEGASGAAALAAAGSTGGYAAAKAFSELPLSDATLGGLQQAKYTQLTAIQRAAIPHALAGRDILGAAKTGSGKTLAFLVPALEALFRARWDRPDGLGALVLTPTRELAMQIFEELRKIGRGHSLSAGLLIGGKNVKSERDLVNGLNILVATPGRLLQHMDETPGFDAGGLRVLILDEADRIMDMGFRATVDAIIKNLPRERQTLLFSATQTKSVRHLARLSLQDPEYIAVHAEAEAPTPVKLQQASMVVPLDQKLDALWSFIKSHLRSKIVVFVSTCKQARFCYEALRRLRPGVPLRALHGKMKQMRRLTAFYDFCEAKAMVLFATDVAARGLDFPAVDWVVQLDCPEDAAAYIHRVGRTARYVAGGKSLLLLAPSEQEGMAAALAAAGIPIKPIRMNPNKTQRIGPALQALCSKDSELKDMAQRAVTSYVRSYFLQPKRDVFDVSALPLPEYAASMGLLATPRLRFLPSATKTAQPPAGPGLEGGAEESSSDGNSSGGEEGGSPAHRDPAASRLGSRGVAAQLPSRVPKPPHPHSRHSLDGSPDEAPLDPPGGSGGSSDSDSDSDGLLVVKRHNALGAFAPPLPATDAGGLPEEGDTKRKKRKRLRIRPDAVGGGRVVFDDEGHQFAPLQALNPDADGEDDEAATAEQRFADAAEAMRATDRRDMKAAAALRRQQRAVKKAKIRAAARELSGVGGGGSGAAQLGTSPYSHDSDGSTASDSDASDEQPIARRQKRLGGSDDGSHRSDGGSHRSAAGGAAHPEVSHHGMAPLFGSRPREATKLGPTRAQQEALALSLLAAAN